ncbi:nucleotide disphospho-sugar-binding domain-containing protein [Amycolatopsis suaedae]|uniref:DUF1205 domain-containing protein n=1 Tax=Amycolatopsis suaedae TaxID=2510978 RepID=A0A4Q7J1A2_9PSEU|nr:nucleotide disphospho-sugar-binding domain-containing protein [Amycolatopsis suaedae]RZQ61171.1 DUF1205 domain-containing protein [Amycolatopsis suaedae]
MKVLFCALPQKTHVLGMVPLAWALRTAGHEVRFACLPGFAATITQAGLTAVPVGWDLEPEDDSPEAVAALQELRRGLPLPYDIATTLPGPVTWTEERREAFEVMVTYAFGEDNAPMLPALVDLARAWQPDLVVWEPFTYAGPIAAAACGAAHARLLFSVDFLGVPHDWIVRNVAGDPLTAWLTSTACEHGVEFTPDLLAGQFTIDQSPASLRITAPDHEYLSMRYSPYGGAATVPPWLQRPAERPRVALTLGTSATEDLPGYRVNVAGILDALSDVDVEVVATLAEPEQAKLGTVPDNARIVSYVPLDALAATCSAAINHGGFGTLSTFIRHAVPQLTLPHDFEGPLICRKLAEQGAGLTVHADEASGEHVRAGLLRLLTEPAFAERAAALRDEVTALPTPNELVGRIEELTTKYRT